jgi:ORF6N domain
VESRGLQRSRAMAVAAAAAEHGTRARGMTRSGVLTRAADITRAIVWLRGHKVLLDADLAALYGVETKVLLQAVRRNLERFPQDFMIQLTAREWRTLRSQIVTLKRGPGQHRAHAGNARVQHGFGAKAR